MEKIIGQDRPVNFLINSFRNKRMSHAYLFLGPRGVGKSLAAKFFAAFISCENKDDAPCAKCGSCQKIEHHNHPDVFWIRPEENSQGIKIEAVRELQARISLKPYEGPFKIFILEEADYLLEDAANCLLKTLEEPVGAALLILIAEAKDRILPTILSRCQMVKFTLLKRKTIEDFLVDRHGMEREKAEFLSHISAGSLGKAFYFLEGGYLEKRKAALESFFNKTVLDDTAWTNRELLDEGICIIMSILRDSIFTRLGLDELVVNTDQKSLISRFISGDCQDKLPRLMDRLNSYHNWLEHNANSRLILTNLEMDLK